MLAASYTPLLLGFADLGPAVASVTVAAAPELWDLIKALVVGPIPDQTVWGGLFKKANMLMALVMGIACFVTYVAVNHVDLGLILGSSELKQAEPKAVRTRKSDPPAGKAALTSVAVPEGEGAHLDGVEKSGGTRGGRIFLLCWGIWCVALLLVYWMFPEDKKKDGPSGTEVQQIQKQVQERTAVEMQAERNAQLVIKPRLQTAEYKTARAIQIGIDMVGSLALMFGAYALRRGRNFSWEKNKEMGPDKREVELWSGGKCWLLTLIGFFLFFCLICAIFGQRDEPMLLVLVTAPGQVVAVVAFLYVAFGLTRRIESYFYTVWGLCIYYALLQVPAFYAFFIEPVWQTNTATQHVVGMALVFGKLGFTLMMVTLACKVLSERLALAVHRPPLPLVRLVKFLTLVTRLGAPASPIVITLIAAVQFVRLSTVPKDFVADGSALPNAPVLIVAPAKAGQNDFPQAKPPTGGPSAPQAQE